MKHLYALRLRLTVEGPILTQSSVPGEFGLGAVAARNARGEFYLPGSLVKGCILEALTDLGDGAEAKAWLGDATDARGLLVFRDLVLMAGAAVTDGTLHRIEIENATGSVKAGALVIIESPFAPGAPYTFEGDIELISDLAEAHSAQAVVAKALAFVPSVGGLRGVGFGVVQSFSLCEPVKVPNLFFSARNRGSETLELRIRPAYPFCLARSQPDANVFSSIDEIPGGVIKGALAETLRRATDKTITELRDDPGWSALARGFDDMLVSHAFPAAVKGSRPRRLPHSLVRVHGQTIDAALESGPFVARPRSTPGAWRAPAFLWDWKDGDRRTAQEDFEGAAPKWPEAPRELRVRTAIDAGLRRAKESALFAYEMIVPDGLEWIGRVVIPESASPAFYEQLEQAFEIAGLWGFGKTKSRARVDLSPGAIAKPPVRPDELIVTLQTDALLFPIRDLTESDATESTLRSLYEAYFQSLHMGLTLVRYFASQRLAGGAYLGNQFMFKAGDSYHPWMLTEAGSVFVLRTTPQAIATLDECVTLGLPACGPTQPSWQECPYVRQNGYGEIALSVDPAVPNPLELVCEPGLRHRTETR